MLYGNMFPQNNKRNICPTYTHNFKSHIRNCYHARLHIAKNLLFVNYFYTDNDIPFGNSMYKYCTSQLYMWYLYCTLFLIIIFYTYSILITQICCLFQLPVLQRWLYEVYCHYNHVPFHNFQHCFMVTQMVSRLPSKQGTISEPVGTCHTGS